MEKMRFEKYHGLGNDYLVYDCCKNSVQLDSKMVASICERHYGLGSDGILAGPCWGKKVWKKGCAEKQCDLVAKYLDEDSGEVICRCEQEGDVLEERFGVVIWNPDGSQAEKSGNGVRIFAKYLKDAGYVTGDSCVLETMGGEVRIDYLNQEGSSIRASMGSLSFDKESVGAVDIQGDLEEQLVEVPMTFGRKNYLCTCVSVGNPHCVITMPQLSRELVCQIGKDVEESSYFPKKINTQIVNVIDRQHIEMEIYERGAGYTLASGTSCCAAAGAMYKTGKVDSNVEVSMPGGTLSVEIDKNMNVYLTGEVERVGSMILTSSFIEKYIK